MIKETSLNGGDVVATLMRNEVVSGGLYSGVHLRPKDGEDEGLLQGDDLYELFHEMALMGLRLETNIYFKGIVLDGLSTIDPDHKFIFDNCTLLHCKLWAEKVTIYPNTRISDSVINGACVIYLS